MDYFLAYTIVWVVGMFILLGLMLFAEYTKLDEVESYFSKNEKVLANKRFWGGGQRIDRLFRMLLMVEILWIPKPYLKAGFVTEAELASVPLALKRWVLWPYYFGFIWLIATVVWSVWRWWCGIVI
ncbi:hypothetical protein [Pseudomonas sp. AMR01]|uniref:hypothetical protein n=1 Tax=Pseudomonas sp. AMR01 TaxID=3064904 RepID=UPI0035C08006